jgi:hypothetical protein
MPKADSITGWYNKSVNEGCMSKSNGTPCISMETADHIHEAFVRSPSKSAVWACREVHSIKGWFPGTTSFPKEWKYASFPYGCKGLLGQKPAKSLVGKAGPIPWPPRYLDLIPCDFYLWWYMKHQVFKLISQATANINMPQLQHTWKEFEYCIDVCRVINGAYNLLINFMSYCAFLNLFHVCLCHCLDDTLISCHPNHL